MEAHMAADAVDVQEFQFKLQRSVQIFDSSCSVPPSKLCLVAAASVYGLVFVGAPDKNLHILQIRDIINGSGKRCARRIIPLPSTPLHVALNCTNELLSIVLCKNDTLAIVIYKTKDFLSEGLSIYKEIQLNASLNANLCNLIWNPCQEDSLAVCTSDGSLSIFQCKPNSIDVQTKATAARCLSWSPKGKQIVTGNVNGTLSQYKPDLSLVKNIPAPQLNQNNTTEAIAIHWISNYQFCVVFNNTSENESRTCVTVINTPKTGNPNCVNYEDICYSMSAARELNYYLVHLPSWGIILASSANSIEIGELGTTDQTNWQQWLQMDEARAELPLTDDKLENYPIGVCYDNSATVQLPWGDSATLPHMPMIHILSHTGLLVTYFFLNITPNAPQLCNTPNPFVLPANSLTEDFPVVRQNINISDAKSNPQKDFSFAANQNLITSTPTVPKTERVPAAPAPSITTNNLFKTNVAVKEEKISASFENKFQHSTTFNQAPANFISASVYEDTNSSNISGFSMQSQQQPKPVVKPANVEKPKSNSNTNELIETMPSEMIKPIIIMEVNNFQKELHELVDRCKNIKTIIGNAHEMNKIATVLSENSAESLKKDWSKQEIKNRMIYLKHNLIKTCAFLAEAKMQPVALEFEQLAQLDPVSSEKMSSIKVSSYYIESQLEQINSALDEHWEMFQNECMKKAMALRGVNDKDYMKMPTLDKIYKPLLKQSDILAKQQVIVSSLQKSVESLGYSKNVSNKQSSSKDNKNIPMPELTKDLLNLSLKSNVTKPQYKDLKLKHHNLRKSLKNYNTIVIKPTKFETPTIFQSLEFYNKSLTVNKAATPTSNSVKSVGQVKKETPEKAPIPKQKVEPKAVQINESNPLFTLNNFVSNLNTNNQTNVTVKPIASKVEKPIENPITITPNITAPQPVQPEMRPNVLAVKNTPNLPTKADTQPAQSFFFNTKSDVPTFPSNVSAVTQAPTFDLKALLQKPINAPVSTSAVQAVPAKEDTTPNQTISKDIFKTQSSLTANPPAPVFPSQDKSGTFANQFNFFNISTKTPTTTQSTNVPNAFNFQKAGISDASKNFGVTITPVLSSDNNVVEKTVASIPKNLNSMTITQTTVTIPETPKTFQATPLGSPSSNTSFTAISSNNDITTSGSLIVTKVPQPTLAIEVTLPKHKVEPVEAVASPIVITEVKEKSPVVEKPVVTEKIAVVPAVSAAEDSTNKPAVFSFDQLISKPAATLSLIKAASEQKASAATTPPLFGAIQKPMFSKPTETPTFGAPVTTSSVFGAPAPVNTCASSLFGAANAAIDTSVVSMFGSTSITTSDAGSVFKNQTQPASAVFGGGAVFGSQTTFGKTNSSIFGGSASSAFGQAQPQSGVFGGAATFGGFGATTQYSNIFGQTTQSINTFGSTPSADQNPFGKNTFGSPTTQSSSIFGSTQAAPATPVFGGSPSFGSKSVFGQSSSFGSPSGSFGMFNSSQPSVTQSGFGSPSSFGKPSGGFASNPEFGAAPVFGSSPTFGATPAFCTTPAFGMQSTFGMGNQQSTTFENLATQSSPSFGNLAQQTPSLPQPASQFQASPAFSNWR